MKIEQRFIAFDGKEFKTEEDCIKYETSIRDLPDIITSLKKVKKMCSENQLGCQSCIFYNDSLDDCILKEEYPEYWDLERIGIKNEI